MLIHPTIDKLIGLRLSAMARALREQMNTPEIESLSFLERLGILVDTEQIERQNTRTKSRLKKARLRQSAAVEDIDWRHPRGLDRSAMLSLAGCAWIARHQNVLITGPTGVGKSYLACALAHKAIREGFTALYHRAGRLFAELALAKLDGRYPKVFASLAKTDLLVIDDFGLAPLEAEHRRDLLEIVEERHGRRSTIMTSQMPVGNWHEAIGDPTLADAILDRLVHSSHKLELRGESMRKNAQPLTQERECEK